MDHPPKTRLLQSIWSRVFDVLHEAGTDELLVDSVLCIFATWREAAGREDAD